MSRFNNCIYIPWGTDVGLFKPINTTKLVNDSYVTFFHSAGMGGLNLRKGTDALVKAFDELPGNSRLVIHSQVRIDKYGKDVSDIIKNNKRIEFVCQTVTAPGLYHLGDVYVYPTRLEGIGLTICEALSCGLPVITTDSPPMNEFVSQDINGDLIEVEKYTVRSDGYYWPESHISQNNLTKILNKYANDVDLVLRQKHNARNYALKHCDWAKNSSELIHYIDKLNTNKRTSALTDKLGWLINDLYLFLKGDIIKWKTNPLKKKKKLISQ
jgi:glycosyltransferase involved in cell wall biosynthesis